MTDRVPAHSADGVHDTLDLPVRQALAWIWSYAAVSAVVALCLGDAVSTATAPLFPAAPTKFVTMAFTVIASGVASGGVLPSVIRIVRNR